MEYEASVQAKNTPLHPSQDRLASLRRPTGASLVHTLPVSHAEHGHGDDLLADDVEHAIGPDAQGPDARVFPLQFLSSKRVLPKKIDRGVHAQLHMLRQISHFLPGFPGDDDAVRHNFKLFLKVS